MSDQMTGSVHMEPESGLPTRDDVAKHQLAAVTDLAHDLVGQFDLEPLLHRILQHAASLLSCSSGSISLVNEGEGTYTKMVDFGVGCQEGETFSLREGVTGEVVRSRATVILDSYAKVRAGHIAADDPRSDGAVIGVPIRREGEIIGAFVIFSTDAGRLFTTEDAGIAEMFANHAAIAMANAEMHALAREREDDIVIARERERVYQEIHATIRRSLGGLTATLAEAQAAVSAESPDSVLPPLLRQAQSLTTEALDQTQCAVNGVSPGSLGSRSVQAALEHELDWIASRLDIHTEFTVVGEPRAVHPAVAHQLYRIGQEALSNVVAHARASGVRLGLVYRRDSMSLLVEDDGQGFDLEEVQSKLDSHRDGCLGLQGMLNRASRLGGSIDMEAMPGWGTRIRATIPEQPRGQGRTSTQRRWRLVVATDQAILGGGVVRLLQSHEPSLDIAAEVSSQEQLFDAVRVASPDVALIDLQLLGEDPTSALERLREEQEDCSVVILTQHPSVDQIRITKSLGVRGFISPDTPPDTLVRVIMAAGRGQTLLEGAMYDRLMDPSPLQRLLDRLTAREQEVFPLVVQGLADKQIGARLNISVKTVEKHVGSLLKKTGARNRTMLAGMVSDQPI